MMPSKTFVVFKVSALDPEKTTELVESLKGISTGTVKDIKREPVGFGIETIKVGVLFDEKDQQGIEKALNEIKKNSLVQEAEIDQMTLI